MNGRCRGVRGPRVRVLLVCFRYERTQRSGSRNDSQRLRHVYKIAMHDQVGGNHQALGIDFLDFPYALRPSPYTSYVKHKSDEDEH